MSDTSRSSGTPTPQGSEAGFDEASPDRILLIEDDEALARVIQMRLERAGYKVEVAPNGNLGLERIIAGACDLTLLDYKLPGRNGMEIMHQLAEMDPIPPVVMISGAGDVSIAIEAMRLGAEDYVIKEVNRGYFDLLESTIRSCLEKRRLREAKRAAEIHLAQKSAQLSATLTSINQGVSVFDQDLRLLVFNDAFQSLYGFPDELCREGTHLKQFFLFRFDQGELGEEGLDAAMARKLAQAVPRTTRIYEVDRPNGTVIEVRANPMPEGGFVSTHTDITERKKSEKALRESEDGYRRMSEFASSVIHNVGNILSSINVACGSIYRTLRDSKIGQLSKTAKLMGQHADEPDFLINHEKGKLLPGYLARLSEVLVRERAETVEEVQSVLKNLLLITQVIEYQQSQGKRDELVELLELSQVVDDAINVKMDAIMRERVEVFTELDVLLVKSQKAKLTHVLINLIKNAVEAMSGNITEPRMLTIRSGNLPNTNEVFLSIQDSGGGISPENLANLFSHGFTTKENGHGFGLHYCAQAMREMNSRIEAHSDGLGKGACFRMIFPTRV